MTRVDSNPEADWHRTLLPPAVAEEVTFLVASVCLSVWVYSGHIIHHYNGIWGTCAPGRRNMHHHRRFNYFLSLVWPSFDLFWVTFQGQSFFKRLRAPRSQTKSIFLVLATSQKKFDLGRSPKIGQMRVIANSKNKYLKNKLGPLFTNSYQAKHMWAMQMILTRQTSIEY